MQNKEVGPVGMKGLLEWVVRRAQLIRQKVRLSSEPHTKEYKTVQKTLLRGFVLSDTV